jgi:hypothetical protein
MFKKAKGVRVLGLWIVVMMVFSLFTASEVLAQNPTITVTQGANGTITPGTVQVPVGTNKKFTITPSARYKILDVLAGPAGASVSVYSSLTWNATNKRIGYYNFVNVTEDMEITATYTLDTRKLTLKKSGDGLNAGTVTDDRRSCESLLYYHRPSMMGG